MEERSPSGAGPATRWRRTFIIHSDIRRQILLLSMCCTESLPACPFCFNNKLREWSLQVKRFIFPFTLAKPNLIYLINRRNENLLVTCFISICQLHEMCIIQIHSYICVKYSALGDVNLGNPTFVKPGFSVYLPTLSCSPAAAAHVAGLWWDPETASLDYDMLPVILTHSWLAHPLLQSSVKKQRGKSRNYTSRGTRIITHLYFIQYVISLITMTPFHCGY